MRAGQQALSSVFDSLLAHPLVAGVNLDDSKRGNGSGGHSDGGEIHSGVAGHVSKV